MTCCAAKNRLRPLSHLPRPLEAIRQFTPNWFAIVMGTGVLALALAQWPATMPGLRALGRPDEARSLAAPVCATGDTDARTRKTLEIGRLCR